MIEVVSIKFKNRGKCYYFAPNGLQIKTGDRVIVETAKGLEIADCSRGNHMVEETSVVLPLRPVARGDRAELLRWCAGNEEMDTRTMASFLDCACACTVDRLTGRSGGEGMSPAELLALHALLDRCRKMLRVNTGVKQLFGLLAVDAIAERGV